MPGRMKLSPKELSMADRLIDSMSGRGKPTDYRDTYTDRVNELIKAKKKGVEVELAEEAPQATNVADLMEVLKRSVDNAKRGRSAAKSPGGQEVNGGQEEGEEGRLDIDQHNSSRLGVSRRVETPTLEQLCVLSARGRGCTAAWPIRSRPR